jgi:small ligand-binding sensory domain FIST
LFVCISSQKTNLQSTAAPEIPPQAFSTGYSTNPVLSKALYEATLSALSTHPSSNVDLAIVHASSLYEEPSKIISHVLDSIQAEGGQVKHIVGNTAGGIIGSNYDMGCKPVECEAVPAVSVTLASLPDVNIQTFYWNDVPEFEGGYDPNNWKRFMGMNQVNDEEEPIFMVIPSPAFQNDLDDLLSGLNHAFPSGQTFGGIASTVSSLSRARIFAYSAQDGSMPAVYGNGCVGVAFSGDVKVDTMIAQGAKPVGGVYRVVAAGASGPNATPNSIEDEGSRSTISAIVLDEAATALEEEAEEEFDEEDDEDLEALDEKQLKRAQMAQDYAKARIPKPPLAEANFIMRRLSDDDQAFMRRALLIGLERGNLINTPNELARLAKGEGHRFTVRQVASAGMKDGSVTFPLGSVNVEVGARCRFFVRDGDFAKKEVDALWTGYKKKELERTLLGGEEVNPPAGCFVYPTLDRGSKLFGKQGFESSGKFPIDRIHVLNSTLDERTNNLSLLRAVVSEYLPSISSVSGFFANGVRSIHLFLSVIT